ncbi:Uncharacterised protein [Mycobacteroides abscessus]|nr:Uncharacterised protein [Mycobacteroides abscessus]
MDPVNESLRTRGSASSGAMVAPGSAVVMTETTPSGTPASRRMPSRASIDSGVCSAGLTRQVQPAANAGPILRVPMASGKFHGVMSRQGPTGRCVTINRDWPSGASITPPSRRTASPANQRKNSAA